MNRALAQCLKIAAISCLLSAPLSAILPYVLIMAADAMSEQDEKEKSGLAYVLDKRVYAAQLGLTLAAALMGGKEDPKPNQNSAVVIPEDSMPLAQPTEPRRAIAGLRPVASGGRPAGTSRLYILNTSLLQNLPNANQPSPAPNFVDFIDGGDFSYEARIDLDMGKSDYYEPQNLALSQDGRRLVVAARGSDRTFFPNGPAPHLAIIDTVAARLEKRINFEDAFWPTSVVLSPDGNTAYAATTILDGTQITGQQKVVIVDIPSGQIQGQIDLPSGGRTGEMAITPDGALLFLLAHLDSARLYEIDVRSRTVVTTISGSPAVKPNVLALRESTELAINPQGTKLYLADAAAPLNATDFTVGVGVVDIATATLTDLVSVPGAISRGSADDVGVTFGGRVIVYIDGPSGLLTYLDAADFRVLHQQDLGQNLWEAAVAEGP